MSAPEILHLSSVHEARDTRIFEKECRSAVEAGFRTTLVAIGPGPDRSAGVEVILLYRRGRVARWLRTVPEVWWYALRRRADLYHLHDPELIPLGVVLAALGRRVVYDAHEDLPHDVMDKRYLWAWVRPVLAAVAAGALRAAGWCFSGVVAATPTIAERFPARRTVTVKNFPRLDELDGAGDAPYRSRPREVLYVGSVTESRGAVEMVDAAARWQRETTGVLVVAGHCPSASLEGGLRHRSGVAEVRILGPQGRREVRALLSSARVGLVTLHPTTAFVTSYPVKMFEYMIAGVPVVASDFPLWRQIISEAGCGVLVDPRRPESIADAVSWLLTHPDEAEAMGQRGIGAVRERYTWEAESKVLLQFYRRLLATPPEVER